MLELASRAVREVKEAADGAHTHVVPVVVEDIDLHLRLLEAAFRHAEFSFVRADDYWGGAPGALEPLLQAEVEAGFLSSPTIEAVGPSLQEENGQVAVRLARGPGPTVNPGLRISLGLVTALFHEEIQHNAGAAVIAYDEGPLDARVRDDAWTLMTERLKDRSIGSLKMLVVLVGAKLDVNRHCTGDVSCRFSIQDGIFLERRPTAVNLADTRRLAQEERLVLFLAAGASVASGMPLGNEMRDYALRHLLADPVSTSESLARGFRAYVNGTGQLLPEEIDVDIEAYGATLTLERVLREELRRYAPAASPTLSHLSEVNERVRNHPSPGITALQDMIRSPRPGLVIVTVNFDTIVQHGVGPHVRIFATDGQFSRCPAFLHDYFAGGDQRVPILKLHGTLQQRTSIVATVERVAEGLTGDKAASLEALVPSGDHRIAAVYVGYSMRDRDVMGVLGLPRYANGWDETWVHPHDVASVNSFIETYRRQIWTSNQRADTVLERTITEPADRFLIELSAAWRA